MAVCTQCGQENPDQARFCNACGAALGGEPEPAREVRKPVTVLFCDVVGSTELGERFDPEVLRGLMARFYAAVRAPVERHGGTVEKVIGDALVAVFGIPTVHEDDALRALRAAVEMRDAVRGLGELQARIGVNTGDVLARDATAGESLVVGDAVNVAARLEQAAEPGEVLVGEATWALAGHAVRGQVAPPIAAKGKSQPLRAYRLDDVDPQAGGHRRRLDLPMIGREAEFDLLRWALQRVAQAQRPHLVTVLGQPGIGKSRLVAEMPRLQPGLIVLTGHCRATTQSSSLEPLLEIAAGLGVSGEEAAARAAELMPGDPDAAAVAACLAGQAGAPDIAWAIAKLLAAAAAAGPLAAVVEDVHWADDLLLDVVEQLVSRGRGQSLLVVCTARPELADRRSRFGAGPNTISISLERLDDVQTRRLVGNADPALDEAQTDQIVAAAEGNPLFAEHLAALVEDHKPGGSLPRSIQVLLAARLEALPDPEREVVGAAAVAGREFPTQAVQALVGRPVDEELDHLCRRELVEPTTPGRHQFGHALLQEAAYELIPKARRAELHLELARWVDGHGDGDAIVGDHLERALRLLADLGQDSPQLAEQAGVRLAAAGRRADALGDPRRAKRLLERALQLLPESGADFVAALIELVAAGWHLTPISERREMLDRGAALAAERRLRALELRARILDIGAAPEGTPGALDDHGVLEQARAAIEELQALPDVRALATALCTLAEAQASLGRSQDCLASVDRALEVLRTADQDRVWALAIMGWMLAEAPLPVAAGEQRLQELMQEIGSRPTFRSELFQAECELRLLRGDVAEAWRPFEAARELELELGRDVGSRLGELHGRLLMLTGRFGEATAELDRWVDHLDRRGAVSNAAVARTWLGFAHFGAGDTGAARRLAEGVIEQELTWNRYEARTRAWLLVSAIELAEGDAGAAAAAARQAVSIAETGDWAVLIGEARYANACALEAAGETGAAAAAARSAAEVWQAKGCTAGTSEAAALLERL